MSVNRFAASLHCIPLFFISSVQITYFGYIELPFTDASRWLSPDAIIQSLLIFVGLDRLIGALAELHIPRLEAHEPKVAEDVSAGAKNADGAVLDRNGGTRLMEAVGSVEEGGVLGVEFGDASRDGGVERGGSVSIGVEEEEEEEEEGWESPVCSMVQGEEAYILSAHMPKMERLDGAALEVGDSGAEIFGGVIFPLHFSSSRNIRTFSQQLCHPYLQLSFTSFIRFGF